MKVYELMERLSAMPAGAEAVIRAVMTAEELSEHEVLEQTEAGENLYSVTAKLDDIDKANEKRVYLYADIGSA